MLAKFSVKKPWLVFVVVVIVLLLGFVSLTTMKTNLLPDFKIPYLAVITTDVGASPEQVEDEVTDTLESTLSSVSGVQNITSTSAENYSMIFLEFTDDTDMDSALVKVSAAVNQVSSQLPESAGNPTYMEMSMDMIASMYLGVYHDGEDIALLTQDIQDSVVPALQRQEGVADVASSGDVTDSIEIQLNQDKIDNVNDGILGEVNEELSEAKSKIDAAERQLDSAEAKLDEQQANLDAAKESAATELAGASEATSQALAMKSVYAAQVASLSAQLAQAQDAQTQAALSAELAQAQQSYEETAAQIGTGYSDADSAKTSTILSLSDAQSQITQGKAEIEASRTELESSRQAYEEQRDAARSQANIDELVDTSTLASLITAQDLEMPAGYVEDPDNPDSQWVVKMGDSFSSAEEIEGMVLTEIDGVGEITIGDVADVVWANDAGDSYAKMNGQDAILLSITKQSTANTGEVCDAVNAEIEALEQGDSGLHISPIMDQGAYIDLYISTILNSLLLGAVLAVVVLAVFLKRLTPTLVVAFSIPFSVLAALVAMYFTDLDLNIMTLGALSLSIGMLVDNSIVVMENIYRMRARGLSAARASAQGALQVTGAVVASTLTSVCVFLPMVFTEGTVRELMIPFALSLSYSLLASLIVALTVVPAISSKLFEKTEPASVAWFERLKGYYGTWLERALDHKAPVLLVAVALLALSCYLVVSMGIVMLPTMSSNQLSMYVQVDDEIQRDEAYGLVDIVGQRIANLDGISEVGIADSSTTSGTVSAMQSMSGSVYSGLFMLYATYDSSKINTEAAAIAVEQEALASCEDIEGVELLSENSMESMSSLMGSDATIEVKGDDMSTVASLADQVVVCMEGIEGYTEIEDGQEDADPVIRIHLDKDKVAALNTTVAQIYQQVSAALDTSTTAITLTNDGRDVEVNVDTENVNSYTTDTVLDIEFTDGNGDAHPLSEVATSQEETGIAQITRENQIYAASVTAEVADGYNITLLARELEPKLAEIEVPDSYSIEIAGTNADIYEMLSQMIKLMALGFVLLYLVMVAQFGNLLSPFIIIFTVPLAFTGGLLSLVIAGEQLSMMALLGFVILMGTVVNNGIVFVDYANQLRLGGMDKRAALVACGKTRMRPILMTALTTIISMCALVFSQQIGSGMERGMALVVAGGLLYATIMTLFVVPIVYDIFCRKPLKPIDVGEDADIVVDDAAAFMQELEGQEHEEPEDAAGEPAGQEDAASDAAGRELAAGEGPGHVDRKD